MVRPHLPLNSLRAFEAAARHQSLTKAAIELCVTQAAVSHQVRGLEKTVGAQLFKRLPRGLQLTQEGELLLPIIREAFDRMAEALSFVEAGHKKEPLAVGAVGTFAVGWLLPLLGEFIAQNPQIDLQVSTNNNRIDVAAEGLDFAIKFGAGNWAGLTAEQCLEAPFAPLCVPRLANALTSPSDLFSLTLLRSYRNSEWQSWFEACGLAPPIPKFNTIVFDSSVTMIQAAVQGIGVALAPPILFRDELRSGRLMQPFERAVDLGSYWLTKLESRAETNAMRHFRQWLQTKRAFHETGT